MRRTRMIEVTPKRPHRLFANGGGTALMLSPTFIRLHKLKKGQGMREFIDDEGRLVIEVAKR